MFKWLKSLFKQAQQAQPKPQPGQRWMLRPNGDPFPAPNRPQVQILEVRDGWVRYYMNKTFSDERMKSDIFTRSYQLVEAA